MIIKFGVNYMILRFMKNLKKKEMIHQYELFDKLAYERIQYRKMIRFNAYNMIIDMLKISIYNYLFLKK